jgi:twitching motility protein PilT
VIVIGDVRDAQTAQIALTAAGTGQLVLAVVRQPDSASALEYLVGLFPGDQQGQVSWQLATVLEGAVAQVLLPRRGGGRVAAFEVLIATPPVRTLVRDGKRSQLTALLRAGARHGMRSLDQSWRELVEQGQVDDADLPPFATLNLGVSI